MNTGRRSRALDAFRLSQVNNRRRPSSVYSIEQDAGLSSGSRRRPSFWGRRFSTNRDETAIAEEDDIPLAPTAAPIFTGFSFLPGTKETNIDPLTMPSRQSRFIINRADTEEEPPMLFDRQNFVPNEYFKSRRIGSGQNGKTWTKNKDPRRIWASLIPLLGCLLGIGVAALLVWQGLRSVEVHDYCLVLDEGFSSTTLNEKVWTKEVQVDGFGNGQFEETTPNEENAFIKDGALWIKPTLQDVKLIESTGSIINLTASGTCTGTTWYECTSSTNVTNGTIVNPVRSARLNTKKGASIQYGRIEVTAKFPIGDWLWPAIWLLPVNNTYGDWPMSGEIDLAESRGNNHSYILGGNDKISSTLHWGPDLTNDAWWRTFKKKAAFHTTFAAEFHTFGLEWTEHYLKTYVNSKLVQVLYTPFRKPFWQKGHFPLASANGTVFTDTWAQTDRASTPFDQAFYLILNVAVGGENGWFQDGKNGKPWVNGSPSQRLDFWNARDQWLPTWKDDGHMIVKSVKMWQQKGYRGC